MMEAETSQPDPEMAVARLAHEPERVACAHPAGVEVLGVAIARADEEPLIEGLVHDLDVVWRNHVVRVHHEEALVRALLLVQYPVEREVEHPALAAPREVVSLPHDGSGLSRHLRRPVRARVRDDVAVDEAVVALRLDRAHEVADDRLLVVRRDDERIRVAPLRDRQLHLSANHDPDGIEDLVEICEREEDPDEVVEDCDGGRPEPGQFHAASFHN